MPKFDITKLHRHLKVDEKKNCLFTLYIYINSLEQRIQPFCAHVPPNRETKFGVPPRGF